MPKIKKKQSAAERTIKTFNGAESISTGEIVFAKLDRSNWWPGIIVDGSICCQYKRKENFEWVYWYQDERVSYVSHSNICSFREQFSKIARCKSSKKFSMGVEQAIKDCAAQDGFHGKDKDALMNWAKNGFPSYNDANDRDLSLSKEVKLHLESFNSYMKSKGEFSFSNKKQEDDKNESPSRGRSPVHEKEESDCFNVAKDVAHSTCEVSLEIMQTMCISCRDSSKIVQNEHPLFHGGICDTCEECLKRYMFALDDDGFMVVCSVCGNNGELLLCDKPGCRRVYCCTCIEDMIYKNAVSIIKSKNPWICFLCKGYNEFTGGLLVPREDWWENVTKLFIPSSGTLSAKISLQKDRGIRVLSLFDGISAGYIALSELGIKVDCYCASEIDDNAMTVSKYNFPGKITYVGDIELLTNDKIAALGHIDLVIGGSPCNDLSRVNPARKGLYDSEGTGRLFFEFFRVLKYVQEQRSGVENPVFWMYENVASMPTKYRDVISRFLGCDPALIDAKDFSAQHRPRFFWCSIPGVNELSEVETNDCPTLSSILSSSKTRVAAVTKINTVTTQKNSLKTSNIHPVLMNGEISSIWITELEEVFGFPRHYTDVANYSSQQRLKLLGKSWSIPVIKNIFSPLRHIFAVDMR